MSHELERQLDDARDERDFLREQIGHKDRTIDALLERDKETSGKGSLYLKTPRSGVRTKT